MPRRHYFVTGADRLRMKSMTMKGFKAKEIAEVIGCSDRTVLKHLREIGIEPYTAQKIRHYKIIDAYRAHVPIRDICASFNITRTGIDRILARYGIARNRHPIHKEAVHAP